MPEKNGVIPSDQWPVGIFTTERQSSLFFSFPFPHALSLYFSLTRSFVLTRFLSFCLAERIRTFLSPESPRALTTLFLWRTWSPWWPVNASSVNTSAPPFLHFARAARLHADESAAYTSDTALLVPPLYPRCVPSRSLVTPFTPLLAPSRRAVLVPRTGREPMRAHRPVARIGGTGIFPRAPGYFPWWNPRASSMKRHERRIALPVVSFFVAHRRRTHRRVLSACVRRESLEAGAEDGEVARGEDFVAGTRGKMQPTDFGRASPDVTDAK
ncbi:hypothetical protein PUN28_005411 [Cardiocondyla obscurior]|uniref:Uncharacterized protein n=1 Tax=Cardiocondyla obscurior TaxID=286306 RepID=A0AAW2GHK9_9HYME